MATNSDRATEVASPEQGRPERNVFRIQEHVRTTHGPDGATAMDIRRGRMFRLNPVGSRILEFMKQGSTEAEIAKQLAHELGIDLATAEADVHEFIDVLERRHALIERAGNSRV